MKIKKGISLIALIITIIVLIILTAAAVLTGFEIMPEAQLAVFYNNISNVQDAVILKRNTNLTHYVLNSGAELEKYKWVDIVNGYTENSAEEGYMPSFNDAVIQGINVAKIDYSVKNSMSISDEEFEKYYVDSNGIVYYDGFLYDGITYYNRLVTSETIPATNTEPIPATSPESPDPIDEGPTDGSYNTLKGVNSPKLAEGMIAVYWDSNGNEITSEDSNFVYNDWYDYSKTSLDFGTDYLDSKWANAKTSDGSYWVWIPRFAYNIQSGFHIATAGPIAIDFLKGTSIVGSSDNTTWNNVLGENKWNIHPAFYYTDSASNTTQIPGYWIMKYMSSQEYSSDEGSTWVASNVINQFTKAAGNSAYYRLVSKPGVQSWSLMRNFNAQFQSALYYNEGIGINDLDSHLIRNIEYAAVSYLAHSAHGRNGITSWSFTCNTEYTGHSQNALATTNTQYSSNGNASGVYDWCCSHTVALYCTYGIPAGWTSLSSADAKYKEIYGTYGYEPYGTAIYETSSTQGAHSYAGTSNWGGVGSQGFTCPYDDRCYSLVRAQSFSYSHSHCAGDSAYSDVPGFGHTRIALWVN